MFFKKKQNTENNFNKTSERKKIQRDTGAGVQTTLAMFDNPNKDLSVLTVFACVRVIAETLGMIPFSIIETKEDGTQVESEHPLNTCLSLHPNSIQTASEFWEYCAVSLCLHGNFYAQIIRDSEGRVRELFPIPPGSVGLTYDNSTATLFYNIMTKEQKYIKTDKDVFHVKLFSVDGLKGVSVISYARNILNLEDRMSEYANNVFNNGSICNGAISVPTKLNKTSYLETLEVIEDQFGGTGMRPMLLEGGASWQSIQMSAQDSQFLETKKFNRAEIAKLFRVPPHMVGDMEHSTFSNIEHQSLEFITNTIAPYINKIEQRIKLQLLSTDERKYLKPKFDLSSAIKGDLNSRYSAYSTAINNGILSPDECRASEGLPPRADGKGGGYIQQLNVTSV